MNPLAEQLKEDKEGIAGVTKGPGNPLASQLSEEKEAVVIKMNGNQPPGSENPPPPPREEPKGPEQVKSDEPAKTQLEVDWQEHAGKLLKLWDSGTSRALKYLAKDDNLNNWKLSNDDKEELLPWVKGVAEKHKIMVDSPEVGLILTLGFVYMDKGAAAWKIRQLKEELEEERARSARYREQVERAGGAVEQPAANTVETSQPTVEKKVETVQGDTVNQPVTVEKTTQTPVETKLEAEMEAVIIQLKPQNSNSTASTVEAAKTNPPVENKTDPPAPPKVEEPAIIEKYRYLNDPKEPNTVCVEFWQGNELDDAKNEPYEPLKEKRDGREVVIRRCLQTKKLFEAFAESEKKFINAEAKNAYHYQQGKKAKKKEGK